MNKGLKMNVGMQKPPERKTSASSQGQALRQKEDVDEDSIERLKETNKILTSVSLAFS